MKTPADRDGAGKPRYRDDAGPGPLDREKPEAPRAERGHDQLPPETAPAERIDGQVPPETAVCDVCGGTMIGRHCKLACVNCGYQRDCSDP